MYLCSLIKVATIYFVRAGTRCRTTRYQVVVALGPIRPRLSFYCFVPVQHRDVWGTEISIWLGRMYHFVIHFTICLLFDDLFLPNAASELISIKYIIYIVLKTNHIILLQLALPRPFVHFRSSRAQSCFPMLEIYLKFRGYVEKLLVLYVSLLCVNSNDD